MATSQTSSAADVPDWMQEEELGQEERDIIASLPSKTAWLGQQFHQYNGFWYTARMIGAVLSMQKHFQALDTDILLATSPKAGTTWMKAFIFALVNRRRYPNIDEHRLLEENPHALVPFLEFDVYDKRDAIDISSYESPRVFSTHLPFLSLPDSVKETNCKIVYMSRNPKDVLVSLWKYTNKLTTESMESTSLEVAFDRFCRGETPFGPLWDSLLGYWNQSLENPQKVIFLKYEEMKENPRAQTIRLAEFLGCPFSGEEERRGTVDEIIKLCSFEQLSKLEVNKSGALPKGIQFNSFFRKGETGDWKNHLTLEMANQIDRLTAEKLNGSGLEL